MELNIFHFDTFERLAVIDEYEEITKTLNYRDHSELEFVLDATDDTINYFVNNNDDIFITYAIGKVRAFRVDSVKYTDETKSKIFVYCKSLSIMLYDRIIDGQQIQRGTVESVMRGFVNTNSVNPSNINRKIDNLILGHLNSLSDITEETYSNKLLDNALWEIAIKYDVTFDIFADVINKNFVFEVWKGTDRTSEQSVNDAVIFAKEFDNVLAQSYTDDKSSYKTTVLIAGEGEGTNRTKLIVGNEIKGRHRRETFVDARDLQSDTEEESLSSAAYEALLRERAKSKQADMDRTQAFETDIEYNSQFVYGVDYVNGDKVTIRNDEINIIMHTRVITAEETYDKKGYSLKIDFGSATPTLFTKIKKAVKQQ